MAEPKVVTLGVDESSSISVDVLARDLGFRKQDVDHEEACLSALADEKDALLLLDLDARPMDEIFFQRLERAGMDCSVILLSSRTFHPELRQAMRAHIFASLHKPLQERELRILLQAFRESRNLS